MEIVTLEFIAVLTNFLIVVAILVKFGGPPIMAGWMSRRAAIENSLMTAGSQSTVARAQYEEWSGKVEGIESWVREQNQALDQHLAVMERNLRSQTSDQLEGLRKEAKLVMEAEKRKANRTLYKELVESALGLTRTYLGSHVSDKDQKVLVANFMEVSSNGHAQ